MRHIFLDTSYLIALINRQDEHHDMAKAWAERLLAEQGTRTIMNIKQQQLVHELFDAIQAQFPEITLLNVSSSPENPQDIWVNVTAPNDDAREGALLDIASERSLDILLEHGYSILIMPEHRSAIAA